MALADVVIFNKSTKYDMEITYNFCSGDSGYTCTPNELIKIKRVGTNNKDGYAVIQTPPVVAPSRQFVNIISAVQKDGNGKVVAEALYNIDEIDGFECGASTVRSDNYVASYKISRAIYLEDHAQLPIITCSVRTYNKELIK